jgi:ribonuclease P protein component
MLDKNHRLDKKTFNQVYQSGTNIQSEVGYFKVLRLPGQSRFACVASKKDSHHSTTRTRIRRRGYAAIREHLQNIPTGFSVIWFLPPAAENIDFKTLSNAAGEMIFSLNKV